VIPRAVAFGTAALVFGISARAQADSSSEAQADALFNEAKHLRDAGQVPEACSKFAQSQQLSPGVGITLHLGDCYERMGRTASAWQEFRVAEKLAREHNDEKRAEVADRRAQALEPKLNRLTIGVPPAAASSGGEVTVDGARIPPSAWNAALAIDPGDHVVAFAMPGQAVRTLNAHIDVAVPVAALRFEDPLPSPAAGAPPVPAPVPAPAPVATPVATPAAPAATEAAPSDRGGARRWVTYGLAGAGLVGIGVGAALLAANSQSPSDSSGCATPPPDSGLTTGAIVAFAAGGAALISALVVHFTGPHPKEPSKEAALVVTPAPIAGGGGAFLRASF
jgi:hypothetical protein